MNANTWFLLGAAMWCFLAGFLVWRYIKPSYDRFNRHPGWYAYYLFLSSVMVFYIKTEKGWHKWNAFVTVTYISFGFAFLVAALLFML